MQNGNLKDGANFIELILFSASFFDNMSYSIYKLLQ